MNSNDSPHPVPPSVPAPVPPSPPSGSCADATRSTASRTPGPWLVYKVVGNGGAVFERVADALRSDAIHGALAEARTWGEFRRLLPPAAWDEVEQRLLDGYAGVDDEDDADRPRWDDDLAVFEAEAVPGYCEGDYPPWAQQTMDAVLPEDLLQQYAERRSSVHNGMYWHIEGGHADALAEALRQRGYQVERAEFLRGW